MALKILLTCLTLCIVLLKVVPATDHNSYGCFPTKLQHWCEAFSPDECVECNRTLVRKVADTAYLELSCPTPEGRINVTGITYYIEKNWQGFYGYCLKISQFDFIKCSTIANFFNCCLNISQFSEIQCSHTINTIPEWNCFNNCTVNVNKFWFNPSMCRGLQCDTKSNTSNSCYSTLVRIDYKCIQKIAEKWNIWIIIWTVIGCLVVVGIIIGLGVVIFKYHKRKQSDTPHDEYTPLSRQDTRTDSQMQDVTDGVKIANSPVAASKCSIRHPGSNMNDTEKPREEYLSAELYQSNSEGQPYVFIQKTLIQILKDIPVLATLLSNGIIRESSNLIEQQESYDKDESLFFWMLIQDLCSDPKDTTRFKHLITYISKHNSECADTLRKFIQTR